VTYEWLPDFCTHFKNVGHGVANCRWLHPHKQAKADIGDKDKKPEKIQKQITKVGHQKENHFGIGSSKAF